MSVIVKLEVARQISGWMGVEAAHGKMLFYSSSKIKELIESGLGVVIKEREEVASFAAIYPGKQCVEIGSVITNPELRRRGFAKRAIEGALEIVKRRWDLPVIALTNKESTPLFLKLWFMEINKTKMLEELLLPCREQCTEFYKWPECHCHYLMFAEDREA